MEMVKLLTIKGKHDQDEVLVLNENDKIYKEDVVCLLGIHMSKPR